MNEINQDLVTMPVRISKKLVKELRAIQDDAELPSLGAALKAYIDKVQIEAVHERIGKIEEVLVEQSKIMREAQTQNSVVLGHNTGTIQFLQKAISTLAEKTFHKEDLVDNLVRQDSYANSLELAKTLLEAGNHTDNVNCGMYSWLKEELTAIGKAKKEGQKKPKRHLD